MRTTLEGPELAPDGLSPVDGKRLHGEPAAVLEHGFADLHREFAGRDEHERGGDGGAAGFDNVQNRQGECRGLARSGGRLTEKVASGEQPRYGLALNGGGLFVPKGGEHFENLWAEPERRESGRFGGRLFDVRHQNGSRGKAIVDSS